MAFLEDIDVSVASETHLQNVLASAEALRRKVLCELSRRQIGRLVRLGAHTWQLCIGDYLTQRGTHNLVAVAQGMRTLLHDDDESKIVVRHLRDYPSRADNLGFQQLLMGSRGPHPCDYEFIHTPALCTVQAKDVVLSRLNLHSLRTIHLSWADHSFEDLFMGYRDQRGSFVRPCALGSCFAKWLDKTEQFPEAVVDVRVHFGQYSLRAKQVSRWIAAIRDHSQVRHFEFRTSFQGLDELSLEGTSDEQWNLIHVAVQMLPHACVRLPVGQLEASLPAWIDLHAGLPDNVFMTVPVHASHPFSFGKLQDEPTEAKDKLDDLMKIYEVIDENFRQEVIDWGVGNYFTGPRPKTNAEQVFHNMFGAQRDDSPFSEAQVNDAWRNLVPCKRRRFEQMSNVVNGLTKDFAADKGYKINAEDSDSVTYLYL